MRRRRTGSPHRLPNCARRSEFLKRGAVRFDPERCMSSAARVRGSEYLRNPFSFEGEPGLTQSASPPPERAVGAS